MFLLEIQFEDKYRFALFNDLNSLTVFKKNYDKELFKTIYENESKGIFKNKKEYFFYKSDLGTLIQFSDGYTYLDSFKGHKDKEVFPILIESIHHYVREVNTGELYKPFIRSIEDV